MAGRKCKLNDEITNSICENIALGLSYNLTCQATGISFDTFNEWMKAGSIGKQKKFSDFYNKVRAAEAKCARDSLKRIQDAAKNGTWSAAAWLLERRYPEEYGKKDRIDMKSENQNKNFNKGINMSMILQAIAKESLSYKQIGDELQIEEFKGME